MKVMTLDEISQARELVYHAQVKMQEALSSLKEYVELSGDLNTKAYIVDKLEIMTSANHGFMSMNKNLDEVMTEIDALELAAMVDEDEELEFEDLTKEEGIDFAEVDCSGQDDDFEGGNFDEDLSSEEMMNWPSAAAGCEFK
jgi:hypothetical protein